MHSGKNCDMQLKMYRAFFVFSDKKMGLHVVVERLGVGKTLFAICYMQ